MRVSVVVAALAAVASASTLTRRQYPSCAMPCIQSADIGNCSPTDNTCMCKNQSFIDSTAVCVKKNCTGDDLTRANEISKALCLAAGVTLSETATPSATSPATGTGSSTATPTGSTNSAINLSGSPMVGALAAIAGVVFAL
ncbi:unnamed protein product [Rhizoctonia solani]|uniref:CFEM domain-containing protein n=1 Tax=Rhizoctonia solani TaxID=456999 RepID=A0A8H3C1N8_9AGAM|nr:unnamed protein product [Rhizoctonia solani]